MKKIIDISLSIIYLLLFGIWICVFHPIQWIAFKVFGIKTQQKMVQLLNFFLIKSLLVMGVNPTFKNMAHLQSNRPIIIVANHQSMFDIIGIIWFLRHLNPIFVSKIELAKGIPSISLNLRLSGAALIDRKDSRQAVPEIARMAKDAKQNGFAATIFPEGTRSKLPQLKPFAVGGLAILLKNLPHAQILPVAIKGNNKLNPSGFFPLSAFAKVEFTALPIVETDGKTAEEITRETENLIAASLA